jgi:hypothetical protein
MIGAYMPPGAINVLYVYPTPPGGTSYRAPVYGQRDLFVATQSPAFANYQPPGRAAAAPNPPIAPDYHLPSILPTDPGYRGPAARYPGPVCYNGYDPTGAFVTDTLGQYLGNGHLESDTATSGFNFDPYCGWSYWMTYWSKRWDGYYWFQNNFLNAPGQPPNGTIPGFTANLAPVPTLGPEPRSIWGVLGQAMGAAIMVAKVRHQLYPTPNSNPATVFNGGPNTALPPVDTMRDLDAVFLANLGIDINNPAAPPAVAGYYGQTGTPGTISSFYPANNPFTLCAAGSPLPTTPYSPQVQAEVMELLINDMRLSFFGSSPDYPNFQPLNFRGGNDAGMPDAICSGYASSGNPSEIANGVDHHGAPRSAPTTWFSNTGCFFIGKSRFWRIRSRGEVWDNVTNKTLSEGLLDSVVCVDPADATTADPLPNPAGGQWSTHTIYQRWWYDVYRGMMSHRH